MLWSVITILMIPRIICEDDENGGRRAQKNELLENNGYFSVKVIEDEDLINSLWVNMDSVEKLPFSKASRNPYLEYFRPKDSVQQWHRSQSVKLPFNFSFYGYIANEVSVSEDGHICVEKRKPCINYVAPLLKKLFFSENSYLKCVSNETTFFVQWGNVNLSPSSFYEYGRNISLQVTLHKTGSIVFVYKQILSMRTHKDLPPNFSELKIGIANSFRSSPDRRYPYGEIEIGDFFIRGNRSANTAAIELKPLPTCNSFTDCATCTTGQCVWCPKINRCSNSGFDRGFLEWEKSNCSMINDPNLRECPSNN